MTRRHLLFLASAVLAARGFPAASRAQEMTPLDFSTLAQRRAWEAARRLSAEGWKIRDQLLQRHLEPRQTISCPVHLIGGVKYLFLATVRPVECRLEARLVSETGAPLGTALPDQGSRIFAISHEPAATARALLEVTVPWDASAGDLAALYVYR